MRSNSVGRIDAAKIWGSNGFTGPEHASCTFPQSAVDGGVECFDAPADSYSLRAVMGIAKSGFLGVERVQFG